MIGIADAKTPRKPKRLSSFLNAPIALNPVLRPIAIYAIIRVNPKVTDKIKYTNKKVPPPC